MKFKHVYLAALIFGPLLLFFGRMSMTSEIYASSARDTHEAVLRIIPLGTPIDDARMRMESDGFKCYRHAKSRYAGDNLEDPKKGMTYYPPSDFILCTASRWLPDLLPKRWIIIIADRDNVVSNVAVTIDIDTF